MEPIDNPYRIDIIRRRIKSKGSLNLLYKEIYNKFRKCLDHCPEEGSSIELGSGGGFAKEIIKELITSDILPYYGLDLVLDGTRLPFQDESLKFICMLNAFHHISNVEVFLHEAQRCLVPGGRLLIIDQHPGYISAPILKFVHHEPFNASSDSWSFKSPGPLSGANGALAWIVFKRDLKKFKLSCPKLNIICYSPHTPLRYWLTGGLNAWNLLPACGFQLATRLDQFLTKLSPQFGSFVDIEIIKT